MTSGYLLKPLRTLRKACRDMRAAHPGLIIWDCDSCPHGELCAISEQIERERLGKVAKMQTKPSRKSSNARSWLR
jgi:hypothetical protein